MILACLHNVIGREPDDFDRKCSRISQGEFAGFLELVEGRHRLVSFSEFVRMLDEGRHDPRAAALTFDDGFSGVLRYAYPVLRSRGLDAAVFVSPPWLEGGGREPFHFVEIELAFRLTERPSASLGCLEDTLDLTSLKRKVESMKRVKRRLKTLPERRRLAFHRQLLDALGVEPGRIRGHAAADERYEVMDKREVLSLRQAGWLIGSHSLTHRTLSMLEAREAEREIRGSKEMLEAALGEEAALFAYPYGESVHIGGAAPRLCKAAGYRYAFTTIPGENSAREDPHWLKRVDYKEFRRGLPEAP